MNFLVRAALGFLPQPRISRLSMVSLNRYVDIYHITDIYIKTTAVSASRHVACCLTCCWCSDNCCDVESPAGVPGPGAHTTVSPASTV